MNTILKFINKIKQNDSSHNNTKCLRECAYYSIEDDIPTSKLLEVDDFLMKEATDYQILSFLFEGKIPTEKSNPEKQKIYFDILNEFEWGETTKAKPGEFSGKKVIDIGKKPPIGKAKILGAAVVAFLILKKASSIYKNYLTSQARACMKSPEGREECLKNVRAKALEEKIKAVKNNLSSCSHSSDPAKCQKIARKQIEKLISKRNQALKIKSVKSHKKI